MSSLTLERARSAIRRDTDREASLLIGAGPMAHPGHAHRGLHTRVHTVGKLWPGALAIAGVKIRSSSARARQQWDRLEGSCEIRNNWA